MMLLECAFFTNNNYAYKYCWTILLGLDVLDVFYDTAQSAGPELAQALCACSHCSSIIMTQSITP